MVERQLLIKALCKAGSDHSYPVEEKLIATEKCPYYHRHWMVAIALRKLGVRIES
jgi:hypothetical protein